MSDVEKCALCGSEPYRGYACRCRNDQCMQSHELILRMCWNELQQAIRAKIDAVEKQRDEARELVRRMAFYNHKSFWEVDIARPYAGEKFTQPRTFVTDLEACQDAVKRWESEK